MPIFLEPNVNPESFPPTKSRVSARPIYTFNCTIPSKTRVKTNCDSAAAYYLRNLMQVLQAAPDLKPVKPMRTNT